MQGKTGHRGSTRVRRSLQTGTQYTNVAQSYIFNQILSTFQPLPLDIQNIITCAKNRPHTYQNISYENDWNGFK